MIRFPTILVLGAGASIPYGFPSGLALRERLCSKRLVSSLDSQYPTRMIEEFVGAFQNSNIASIDAFLTKRPEYSEIGKVAISSVICSLENPKVFNMSIEDNWYFLLWNKLVSEVETVDDLKKNEISIITFNYDRSLEYFLLTSIKHTFKLDDLEAYEALKSIPIIHFYGQLGHLPNCGSRLSYPYQINNNPRSLSEVSNNIRVIPEGRVSEEHVPIFKEWFTKARNIFFLGFGYDPLNISRLGLKETLDSQFGNTPIQHLSIFGSAYGLTDAEARLAGTLLTSNAHRNLWDYHKGTCTQTLREFADKFY